MPSVLIDLFDTSGFPPRWQCGVWPDWLGWLHVLSDLGTFSAYTAIPLVLCWFVLRKGDVPFPKIFWLFAAFIFACGTVHLLEAVIFWKPVYRLSGFVKLFTALVSWATIVALVRVMPEAMRLPGLARLNDQLRERELDLATLFTREQEARAEAERSSQLKEEFLSTVSHELRTPLNAVLGYTQILLGGKLPEAQRRQVEIIERNARSQARLIDDLLDMSRIDAGKSRLELEPLDLAAIARQVVAAVRPSADERGVQLADSLPEQGAPVWGDALRLQQVAWNLLTNAIKFTPRGGHVEVSVARVGTEVALCVSDDGEGIAAGFLPHVFDRFRQGEPARTRQHEGLGLGLSIVKRLTELHGGRVAVSSAGLSAGATFTVTLPVREGGQPPLPTVPTLLSGPHAGTRLEKAEPFAGREILVVEDDEDARELLRLLLERGGASVRAVGSANEALSAFRERTPDLVLSDIGMPGTDGYDLMRLIRALPPEAGGDVPGIAVTALARTEDRLQSFRAGFQAHVGKPIDTEELFAVIAAVLGTRARDA